MEKVNSILRSGEKSDYTIEIFKFRSGSTFYGAFKKHEIVSPIRTIQ